MAKKKCPKCNTSNSGDAMYCRHCGEKRISQNQQSSSNASNHKEEGCFMIVLHLLGVFVTLVLFFGGIITTFAGETIAGPIMAIIGVLMAMIINRNE